MPVFKDFSDKKLVFQPRVTYRCLYLDDASGPRMFVFDKSVRRGDVMSLLGAMSRDDEAGAKTLATKKAKLRSCAMTSDGKRHTLAFADEVNASTIKSRLKTLNSKIAAKLDIVTQAQVDDQTESSSSESESSESSDVDTTVVVDGLKDLVAVEAALETWRVTYGDPPAPGAPPKALEDLKDILDDAKEFLDDVDKTAFPDQFARATEVIEAARVLTARVELQSRQPKFNAVHAKPLLAWAWCKSNVARGKLKDVLEKVLVPYEAAVKAFQRAPSKDAIDTAIAARNRVESALIAATDHYLKKGGEDTKLSIATALLALAREQATVLAGLVGKLGDLDPATCAQRGAVKLRATSPSKQTVLDQLDQARRDLDTELQDWIDKFTVRLTVTRPTEVQNAYEDALRVADEDTSLTETQRTQAKAAALVTRDEALGRLVRELEAGVAQKRISFEEYGDRAVRDHAVKGIEWSMVGPRLTPKLPLHKALGKALPPYNAARDELGKGATPERLAATWRAFQVLDKAFQKAASENDELAVSGDPEEKRKATLDQAFARRLKPRLVDEKKVLEEVEGELPQGVLAGELAGSEEGRATLDGWVAALGGKASTEDEKATVRTAMKARFQIKRLDGDMSTKALPELYKILSMVPEGQTRDNEKLTRIVRDQSAYVPDGFYAWDEDTQDGVLSMDMPRTGNSGVMKQLFGQLLPHVEAPQGGWKDSGVKKSNAKIIFQHLTLHEVGHSVDEQLGFMEAREGNASYGDWRPSNANEVQQVALVELGFGDALDGVQVTKGATPPTAAKHLGNDPATRKLFLTNYLRIIHAQADPAKDTMLTLAADGFDVPWKALASHPAVVFLKASKLNPGTMQQVTQWNEKGKASVAGGRVYQEAYEDTWWSYDVGARERGIGGYQFRAPGEWFAEIYACYYGGRLKSSHPDYAWMKALVDSQA